MTLEGPEIPPIRTSPPGDEVRKAAIRQAQAAFFDSQKKCVFCGGDSADHSFRIPKSDPRVMAVIRVDKILGIRTGTCWER